jgi:hypothetical protein
MDVGETYCAARSNLGGDLKGKDARHRSRAPALTTATQLSGFTGSGFYACRLGVGIETAGQIVQLSCREDTCLPVSGRERKGEAEAEVSSANRWAAAGASAEDQCRHR